MSDHDLGTAAAGGSSQGGHPPIIDYDLPCPQCGYNLHGLAELRCPECGVQFESMQTLQQYQQCEWPAPGLTRILRTIYLHPLAFWDMPAVRFGRSPSVSCLLAVVALPAAIVSLVPALAAGHRAAFLEMAEQFLLCFLISFLLLLVLVLAHGSLCRMFTSPAAGEDPDRRGICVAVYSAMWLTPAVLCVAGAMICSMLARNLPNNPLWQVKALCLAAVLAVAGLWAATLYRAGLVMSRGRHAAAIWCMLTNLLWLPLGLLAMAS